jgi:hypothetical protein
VITTVFGVNGWVGASYSLVSHSQGFPPALMPDLQLLFYVRRVAERSLPRRPENRKK